MTNNNPIRVTAILLIAFVMTGAKCASSKTPEIVLAQNGKSECPIVIAKGASESTEKLAQELAAYLKRITGATFQVTKGNGESGIVLGTQADFPTLVPPRELEIRNDFDGREAYVIRSESKRLILLGATETGASNAVFRFL